MQEAQHDHACHVGLRCAQPNLRVLAKVAVWFVVVLVVFIGLKFIE